MRYTLRNKDKITKAYDQKYLDRMIKSLDKYFDKNKKIEVFENDGEKYEMIMVDDIGHTVNIFVFYVIRITFDVYNLAFKEVIG